MAEDLKHPGRLRTGPIVLFVTACLIGLGIWAPAAWLVAALPASISCSGVSGSVWHGRCTDLRWVNSLGVARQFGDITWQWRPSSLLRLAPEVRADWRMANARMTAALQWKPNQQWQIRNLRLDSDYRSLHSLVGRDLSVLWRGVALDKTVSIDIANARGRGKDIEHIEARLTFFAYGHHALLIQPSGRGLIQSDDGPLQLEGPLEWQPSGQFRLRLKVSLAPNVDDSLRQALTRLGPSNSTGQHDLTIEGSLWTLLQ